MGRDASLFQKEALFMMVPLRKEWQRKPRPNHGSLVQRELSAQLTEGLFRLLHRHVDILAHPFKILRDCIVRDPKYTHAEFFKICAALFVVFLFPFVIMLTTVQFNGQFHFRAIEVRYISSKHFLPCELNRIFPKKMIP